MARIRTCGDYRFLRGAKKMMEKGRRRVVALEGSRIAIAVVVVMLYPGVRLSSRCGKGGRVGKVGAEKPSRN